MTITGEQKGIKHGGLSIGWVRHVEFELINASSYHRKVATNTWPVADKLPFLESCRSLRGDFSWPKRVFSTGH